MHEICRDQPLEKQCGDCLYETAAGLRAEIKRLEGVVRLAGRKLAACEEYADTGEDGQAP